MNMTFSELSYLWLKTAQIGLSYPWQCQLESNVKHLNRFLGEMDIVNIKPCDIEAALKTLSIHNPNTNKPASKRLLKAISNTVNRIFEFGIENEYAVKNPAVNSAKRVPKNAPTKIVEGLTDLQQTYVMVLDHPFKIAIALMMFTGLRTGELLALEWKDFDFTQQYISVTKSCAKIAPNRYIVKPGTKNGKTRRVPIPQSILPWLEDQWLTATSKLVVSNSSGNLHTPCSWRGQWRSYQNELNYYVYSERCKKRGIIPKSKYSPTGIPDMNIKFNAHQLRHTFATMLYKAKVDILTAKELLGHSDIKTTLGIYTHLDEKFKRVSILQFDDYIQNELLKVSSL